MEQDTLVHGARHFSPWGKTIQSALGMNCLVSEASGPQSSSIRAIAIRLTVTEEEESNRGGY